MAIEKFTTRALVLNQYTSGENDVTLKVFTEEFGVIFVVAKSLKKKEGKLKAHVRKYHFTNLTLVKGKEVWRLTGASEISLNDIIENKIDQKVLIPEVSKLIDRLYHGSEKHVELFERIFNLVQNNKSDVNNLRRTIYASCLIELGYIDLSCLAVSNLQEYRQKSEEYLLFICSLNQSTVNSQIRRALRESML